ncbi:hypothetical protein ZIOFF_048255 [Zingiber officinale]|uniref:Uncharacterized protein n=1 Tax=Zingiber officinale TaxID=94328 RepID=A0A8J5KMC6_ZINOF|nr:hypothetical protein ZIOFF_048255 [Zingiber officinale]
MSILSHIAASESKKLLFESLKADIYGYGITASLTYCLALLQNPTRTSRSLGSFTRGMRRGAENPNVDANGNTFDSTTKSLHLAWHPTENLIACAAANSLYMYYA